MSIDYAATFKDRVEFLNEDILELPKVKDPFDPAPLCDLFKVFRSKIDDMITEADLHDVTDDTTSDRAVEMSVQAKQLCNAISKRQKVVTTPYHKVKATVDRECKVLKDRLTKIQYILEQKNRPYLTLKEVKRRKMEKKAKAEGIKLRDQLRKEALENGEEVPVMVIPAIPSETKTVTETGTAKLKTDWAWEIEDVTKLPERCLNDRMEHIIKAVSPWINAQIKAGIRKISGVNVYETTKIQTRVRR